MAGNPRLTGQKTRTRDPPSFSFDPHFSPRFHRVIAARIVASGSLVSPLVGRVAREGGRCEFRCPLEERGENRRIHFDGGEILLRSIEISHGEGGGWRSLISKDEGAGICNVVLPKARRDCRRVFRAIRKRLESRATFLNSIMHPRILAVFRVSFSTSFSSLQLGREVRRGISLGLLVSSLRRNSRGPRGGILDTRNSGDVECCIQNGDVSLNVFLFFLSSRHRLSSDIKFVQMNSFPTTIFTIIVVQFNSFATRILNERFFSTMRNVKSFRVHISILFPLIIVDHGILL